MKMNELFSGDEKLTLYVKKFKEEFTKGFRKDEKRGGTSGGGNDDGNEDGADNNEVDVAEENEATEMGIDALIYLHYTKINGMVMMQRKWPAIRNWTSQDVVDRQNFEMSKGHIGLVEVIEDDDKEDENEKGADKWKLRE
nr:hypothetical protein [Tanacetum cinerariifolium]